MTAPVVQSSTLQPQRLQTQPNANAARKYGKCWVKPLKRISCLSGLQSRQTQKPAKLRPLFLKSDFSPRLPQVCGRPCVNASATWLACFVPFSYFLFGAFFSTRRSGPVQFLCPDQSSVLGLKFHERAGELTKRFFPSAGRKPYRYGLLSFHLAAC